MARLIEVKDQQRLLAELLPIEQALRAGASLARHMYIEAGRPCRVTAGPLTGLQGIVLRTKAAARLILQVTMLGQAASVEIDTDVIEIVD